MTDESLPPKDPSRDPTIDPENPQQRADRQLSEQHQSALHKIMRARTRLIVCFWTLPVYVIALWILLSNGRNIESFMFVYMALWAGFAVDMAMRRCPQCTKQFFVKSILLNLITRRCVHCGLSSQEKKKVGKKRDRQEF